MIGCDVKRRRDACADCLMTIGEGVEALDRGLVRCLPLRSDPAGHSGCGVIASCEVSLLPLRSVCDLS